MSNNFKRRVLHGLGRRKARLVSGLLAYARNVCKFPQDDAFSNVSTLSVFYSYFLLNWNVDFHCWEGSKKII